MSPAAKDAPLRLLFDEMMSGDVAQALQLLDKAVIRVGGKRKGAQIERRRQTRKWWR